MILNNWYNYVNYVNTTFPVFSNRSADMNIIATDGTHLTEVSTGAATNSSWYAKANSNMAPFGSLSCCVGSGTDEPSANDHSLGTDISSSVTSLSLNYATSVVSNNSKVSTFNITGRNSTGSDMTISEVGITKLIYCQSMFDDRYVLMLRELLPTPLTVPDGKGFFITITWTEQ